MNDGKRNEKEYIFTGYHGLTEAFYAVNNETIFKILLLLSNKFFNNYKVHPNDFRIKGRVISENPDFSGEFSIEVSRLDELSSCLKFTRIDGPLISFYKFIEEKLKPRINNILKSLDE